MSRLLLRRALVVLFVLLVTSCGGLGGGCSACGMTPIAGFPNDQTVPNAASFRVTRPGLTFFEEHLTSLITRSMTSTGGVMNFQVPPSQINSTVTVDVCPNGPNANECNVDIDLGNAKLRLDAIVEHTVRITGTIPVRLKNLPMTAHIGIPTTFHVGLGAVPGGTECNNGTPNVDYKAFPIEIRLPLVSETISARQGYTKIDFDSKDAVVNPTISDSDVHLCMDCSILSVVCNGMLGMIKSFVVSSVVSGIQGQLKGVMAKQVCTKPDPTMTPVCPNGSEPDTSDPTTWTQCVYSSDKTKCMPTKLGMDGHLDVGTMFASLLPGTRGDVDLLLVAGGNMDPAPGQPLGADLHSPNGITLGMLGGTLPSPRSNCVPVVANPIPSGIPIPDELRADTPPNWPASAPVPHLGIALSGSFLNYAVGNMYASGVFCINVNTEQVQMLSTGLLSLLVPSMKTLAFEQKNAPVAIAIRPQAQPKIVIGSGADVDKDPLLRLQLKTVAIDFYVWNYDRFVRAFTYTADLLVPLNLQTARDAKNPTGGLLPVLGKLTLSNSSIANAELLTDDPGTVAGALEGVINSFAGQIAGAMPSLDYTTALASMGMGMTISDGGIRKLHKDNEDFVGIFASLSMSSTSISRVVDTSAGLLGLTVYPEAMALSTYRADKLPKLHVRFGSPGESGPIEYSWALDDGARSAWSSAQDVTIQHDALYMQAKHVLKVSARRIGEPATEDLTPALVPFTIDVLAPRVRFVSKGDAFTVDAWDIVSGAALTARARVTGASGQGEFSSWRPIAELGPIAKTSGAKVDVEVRDEVGNVAQVSQALGAAAGNDMTMSGGGMGCSASGRSASRVDRWFGLASVFAAIFGFARRVRSKPERRVTASRVYTSVAIGAACVVAAVSQGCSCGDAEGAGKTGCGATCDATCKPALAIGLVGSYTSVAKAKDGSLWFAGYNDMAVTGGDVYLYGDLVVGKYDRGKSLVSWKTVDGLPAKSTDGTCPLHDPAGWRTGLSDNGDDVGLWTSIALDDQDHPLVSYYDATHASLKFAAYDGKAWAIHTVVEGSKTSDVGRYAKMVQYNGYPMIAYLVIEKGSAGKVRSRVNVAYANGPVPKSADDWAVEQAAVDENGPCRPMYCGEGEVCVKESGNCQKPSKGCTPADCDGGTGACVVLEGGVRCGTKLPDNFLETYPSAIGDYISLASGPKGLGMVVYDRLRGNLVALARNGSTWESRILDGEAGAGASGTAQDTGDVGVGASLAIASSGDWHVSYVNGTIGALQFVMITGGKILAPELVDDGNSLDGTLFPDGRHRVGDDSVVQVDDSGTVTIFYQDATVGTLRMATGVPLGATHKWVVRALAQPSPVPNQFAGYFPRPIPGRGDVANFWRAADPQSKDVVGNVAIVTPQ